MQYADLELGENGETYELPVGGRGGARPGAGRPSALRPGPKKSADALLFDKGKARQAVADAGLKELDLKIKTGQYVARAGVQDASATAISGLAQSMRSIPDLLERKGLAPHFCEIASQVIDQALRQVAEQFEMMAGSVVDEK